VGLMLPTRIDVLMKDGRYGVVLDCKASERVLLIHWGSVERRLQNGEFEPIIYTDWVGCLELKEVLGWGKTGSAVTRLSTVTPRKRTTPRTT